MPTLYNFAKKKGVFMIPSGGTKSPTPTPPSFSNTKSLAFDGVDDYIVLSSDLSYTDEFTISTWINTPTIPTSVQGYYLGHSTNDNWVQIYLTTSIRFKVGGTTLTFTESGGNDLVAGSWNHILLYRSSSGDIGIYVNGATFSSTQNNTNALLLDRFGVGKGQEYSGNIDELSTWDSDQSSNASAIFNGGTPNDLTSLSPITWYRMGDNSTFKSPQILMPENTNKDKVSNWSLDFDGVDDYISLSSGILTDFSLSFWYKGNPDSYDTVVGKTAIDGGILTSITFVSDLLSFKNRPGSWTALTTTTTSTTEWRQYSITYDSTANELKGYCNGALEVTTTPIFSGASGSEHSFDKIGSYFNNYYLSGNLSNLALWNTALTSGNVTTIYNSGTPNDITSLNPVAYWKLGEEATFSTNWTVPDQVGSNDGTSANMTVEDRVGDAPNSDNNSVSYNMTESDIETDTP